MFECLGNFSPFGALITLFSFSTTMFGHSHLQCPVPLHLKHCTSSTTSCLLTFTSFLKPHLITLLASTSNLFWRVDLPFSSCSLFLQLWTKCPNFLYPQYILPSLPSISALSLARACHWLSILPIRELYCSRDMVLYLWRSQNRSDLTNVMSTGVQDLHPARHLLPYLLLP